MPKIEIHGVQPGPKTYKLRKKIKEIFEGKPYYSDLRIVVCLTVETDCDGKEYSCFRLITSNPAKISQIDKEIERYKRDDEIKEILSNNFSGMYIEHFYEVDYVDPK